MKAACRIAQNWLELTTPRDPPSALSRNQTSMHRFTKSANTSKGLAVLAKTFYVTRQKTVSNGVLYTQHWMTYTDFYMYILQRSESSEWALFSPQGFFFFFFFIPSIF